MHNRPTCNVHFANHNNINNTEQFPKKFPNVAIDQNSKKCMYLVLKILSKEYGKVLRLSYTV